jgi:antitoxin (DNA-binding transcriptional repressor) of toxin-antitoxin stability system
MKTVTIHDAKTNLSKYIAAALQGEKIYIGGFGKAEVVLSKIPPQQNNPQGKRLFAVANGKIKAAPDAFSDATDHEISALMLAE